MSHKLHQSTYASTNTCSPSLPFVSLLSSFFIVLNSLFLLLWWTFTLLFVHLLLLYLCSISHTLQLHTYSCVLQTENKTGVTLIHLPPLFICNLFAALQFCGASFGILVDTIPGIWTTAAGGLSSCTSVSPAISHSIFNIHPLIILILMESLNNQPKISYHQGPSVQWISDIM